MQSTERKIAAFIIGSAFVHLFFPSALAAVTVTPATGGSSISADTAGGSYTTLTGPTITENANRDISGVGTIILNSPSGFVFNTGQTVTATIVRDSGNQSCFTFTSNTATPTTSTITFTVQNLDGNGGTPGTCHVTFSNIQVRPTSGTPLASGNITKTGTSVINGVTNNSTNLGTLTEVAGAKSQLVITTEPSSGAAAAADFATKPVVAVRDQFDNTITSDNTSTITRTAVLSTQACGGTAGSGTLTSTPASGAAISSGVMAYTAMQYSAAESVKICFSSLGVTSALSNTITVSASADTIVPAQAVGSAISYTEAVFSGWAYPHGIVEIIWGDSLVLSSQNNFVSSSAALDGSFRIGMENINYGEFFFALRARDKNDNDSGVIGLNLNPFFGRSAFLNIKDLLVPPTIDFKEAVVALGKEIRMEGYATPERKIETEIDGIIKGEARADQDGFWFFATSTSPMRIGDHYARARQADAGGKTSEFSVTRTFRVSLLASPKADFNGDDRVTIGDWSIFLFRWGSEDNSLRATVDMDNDGKIGISDFSIFLKIMSI